MNTVTRQILVTGSTDKAIRVGVKTWIARSGIVSMVELDLPSEMVTIGATALVGIPHAMTIDAKAAGRAGW